MRKKSDVSTTEPRDTDTASFAQAHGTQDPKANPNRPHAKMPHERDESARAADDRTNEPTPPSDPQISQAQKDVANGQVDTDRRGTPNDIPSGRK